MTEKTKDETRNLHYVGDEKNAQIKDCEIDMALYAAQDISRDDLGDAEGQRRPRGLSEAQITSVYSHLLAGYPHDSKRLLDRIYRRASGLGLR